MPKYKTDITASVAARAAQKLHEINHDNEEVNHDSLSHEESSPEKTSREKSSPKRISIKPCVSLKDRGNYTMVDNDVFKQLLFKIPSGAFCLYMFLYYRTYGEYKPCNTIRIGHQEIMDTCQYTNRTLIDHFRILIERKLVVILEEKTTTKNRLYQINLPSQSEVFSHEESSPEKTSHEETSPNDMKFLHVETTKTSREETSPIASELAFPQGDQSPKDIYKTYIKDNNKSASDCEKKSSKKNSDDIISKLQLTLWQKGFKITKKQLKNMLNKMDQKEITRRADYVLKREKREGLSRSLRNGALVDCVMENWEIPEDKPKDTESQINTMITLIKGNYNHFKEFPDFFKAEFPDMSIFDAAVERCRQECKKMYELSYSEDNLAIAIEHTKSIIDKT